MNTEEKLVRVEVKGLMLDPTSNVPIIILRDEEGKEFLPIWIGVFEANAIALKLENVAAPRPMTHDLLAQVFHELDGEIQQVVICNLEESTFFASIELDHQGRGVSLDARPSDAIALALRLEVPIYVMESVFEKARRSELSAKIKDEERLKKWLEEVDPSELGKYTM